MHTTMNTLCCLAMLAGTFSVAGHHASAASGPAATAHPITRQAIDAGASGFRGRGWCYWHPYECYYR